MKTNEAMKVLAAHRGDAVVVCALGTAANDWWAVTRSEDSFYMRGAMGFAASFALELAITIPDTRRMTEISAVPGPYFIRLRVEAEQECQRPPPFSYEGPEMKYRFGRRWRKSSASRCLGRLVYSCGVSARPRPQWFTLTLERNPTVAPIRSCSFPESPSTSTSRCLRLPTLLGRQKPAVH
jgi:hypothetical protein